MNLTDLSAVASIMSSVAVLVSLIYLSLQIRQARRNQQALMQQARTAGITEMNLAIADPAIAVAYNRGLAGDPNMTETETRQFLSLARCGFINAENNFIQHCDGLMSDEAFHSSLQGSRFQATFPGIRAAWRQSRGAYGKRFVKFMDRLIATGASTPPPNLLADWSEALASDSPKIP
jgi:hypothetical protein